MPGPKKGQANKDEDVKFAVGSGNVFANLGVSNPDEHLAKAELASRINEAIGKLRLTQVATAERLGIDQPKVSRLMPGYRTNFSPDCLMPFLTLLGQDVEIVVKPIPRSRRVGRVRVVEVA
jgi:predicted XRE-type DNA-binding protein